MKLTREDCKQMLDRANTQAPSDVAIAVALAQRIAEDRDKPATAIESPTRRVQRDRARIEDLESQAAREMADKLAVVHSVSFLVSKWVLPR